MKSQHSEFKLVLITAVFLTMTCSEFTTADAAEAATNLRLATFNVSLYGTSAGEIRGRLTGGADKQASQIAAVIQTVRPDILLLNEIDHDADSATAKLFAEKFLAVGQRDREPIEYPFVYSAPSNTGLDSGMDLDGDGQLSGPGDAWGYGVYPGQYSMAVLSRFPIEFENIRTFQKLLWKDFPDALVPVDPVSGKNHYSDEIWNSLRLSSKNHIDVPVRVGDRVIHVLASHPTPPVFDGPEDRNGCRNHDEIRFWNEYINRPDATFLIDDQGRRGGLGSDQLFFIAGDLNSDPADGDSRADAIANLLANPRLTDSKPSSVGGLEAAGGSTESRPSKGRPENDTADFGRNGNMRIDYVLPSRTLSIRSADVFWPSTDDADHDLISASDHRMVCVEVQWPQ